MNQQKTSQKTSNPKLLSPKDVTVDRLDIQAEVDGDGSQMTLAVGQTRKVRKRNWLGCETTLAPRPPCECA